MMFLFFLGYVNSLEGMEKLVSSWKSSFFLQKNLKDLKICTFGQPLLLAVLFSWNRILFEQLVIRCSMPVWCGPSCQSFSMSHFIWLKSHHLVSKSSQVLTFSRVFHSSLFASNARSWMSNWNDIEDHRRDGATLCHPSNPDQKQLDWETRDWRFDCPSLWLPPHKRWHGTISLQVVLRTGRDGAFSLRL